MKTNDSFSQFQEDKTVLDFFGDQIGQFIEIGAAGGVALSNSFALLRSGWKGLLVEPSPIHFQTLLMNHRHQAGAILVNAAVWSERKLSKFSLDATWYSTLNPHPDKPVDFISSYYIPTVTPSDLKGIMDHADFISIDTEGSDLEIFPTMAKAYPGCSMWCVEHGNNPETKRDWALLFDVFSLKVIVETPENFIAVKSPKACTDNSASQCFPIHRS